MDSWRLSKRLNCLTRVAPDCQRLIVELCDTRLDYAWELWWRVPQFFRREHFAVNVKTFVCGFFCFYRTAEFYRTVRMTPEIVGYYYSMRIVWHWTYGLGWFPEMRHTTTPFFTLPYPHDRDRPFVPFRTSKCNRSESMDDNERSNKRCKLQEHTVQTLPSSVLLATGYSTPHT